MEQLGRASLPFTDILHPASGRDFRQIPRAAQLEPCTTLVSRSQPISFAAPRKQGDVSGALSQNRSTCQTVEGRLPRILT
jgi:hypothetical protein